VSTIGAGFRVRSGEPSRTRYEIAAPVVDMPFTDPSVGQTDIVVRVATDKDEGLVKKASLHGLMARIQDVQLERSHQAAGLQKQIDLRLTPSTSHAIGAQRSRRKGFRGATPPVYLPKDGSGRACRKELTARRRSGTSPWVVSACALAVLRIQRTALTCSSRICLFKTA
jgi:hypothetical protein